VSAKAKRIVMICVVAVVYYVAFFACKFTVLENFMLSPAKYQISENCIIVHGQAVTGPDIRVVKGAEFLSASIPLPHPDDLNVSELKMKGKSIYNSILEYPDFYACNWLIYGKVVGTTDEFAVCGSGTIPIFETEEVYPMMSPAVFLALEVILFVKFPWGLIAVCLLYTWPIVVLLVLLLRTKRKSLHSRESQ
jgi:hypothetical protein